MADIAGPIERRRLARLLAALPLAGCAADPPGPCRVEALAAVPLELAGGCPVVTASINGRPARMLVDTGAATVVINAASAPRLGLHRDPFRRRFALTGVGGSRLEDAVSVASLTIGQAGFIDPEIAGDHVVPLVPDLPRLGGGPPLDGVLGGDFLSRYDVELDLPRRRLGLYRLRECQAPPAAWTRHAALIPAEADGDTHRLLVPVRIGAAPLSAVFDTGSQLTVLAMALLPALGLEPTALQPLAAAHATGTDRRPLPLWTLRVPAMAVGPLRLRDVDLVVADFRVGADMLLGADMMARVRIWISYARRQIFLAPAARAVAWRLAGAVPEAR
ncbi:MAG TPA: aspartyl protease family protein [Acetobacteraceae bacterium]|nr:aspartyl protease family protein [Acetobacteraceae bacterium]